MAKFSPDLVQRESTRGHIWSWERLPVGIFGPGSVCPWPYWSRERLPVVRFGPGRVYPWPYLVQAGSVYPWLDLIQKESTPAHIWSRESLPVVRFYMYHKHCRQETGKRRERTSEFDGGSCQHRDSRTQDERARLNSAQGNTATALTTTLSSSLRFHGHTSCLSATIPHLVKRYARQIGSAFHDHM